MRVVYVGVLSIEVGVEKEALFRVPFESVLDVAVDMPAQHQVKFAGVPCPTHISRKASVLPLAMP